MKILVVHNRYRSNAPSGEDRVVEQEIGLLTEGGHTARLFQRGNDEISDFSAMRKMAIPFAAVWNPFSGHAIDQVLDEFRPDVVHVHNLFPLLSPSVLRACQRRQIPTVATFHNYRQICAVGTLFRDGAPCYDCLGGFGFPGIRHGCYKGTAITSAPVVLANRVQRDTWRTSPSAYIFISSAQRRLFSTLGLPEQRCFVKWNFVPSVSVRADPKNLVVYTGRLSEAKGTRLLMKAWDTFEAEGNPSGMRLAMAGTGELEGEVRSWAASRGSVDVLGLLNRDECATLLAQARAAIVPSLWPEPFGLVVAEAKSAGVPPVAPAHGAFPELIADGIDGVLFPPADAHGLAHVLQQVERSPEHFESLGSNAREAAAAQFGPVANRTQLESIYRFAIEHPTWRKQDVSDHAPVEKGGDPAGSSPTNEAI